jgi:hypothetical protein
VNGLMPGPKPGSINMGVSNEVDFRLITHTSPPQ